MGIGQVALCFLQKCLCISHISCGLATHDMKLSKNCPHPEKLQWLWPHFAHAPFFQLRTGGKKYKTQQLKAAAIIG